MTQGFIFEDTSRMFFMKNAQPDIPASETFLIILYLVDQLAQTLWEWIYSIELMRTRGYRNYLVCSNSGNKMVYCDNDVKFFLFFPHQQRFQPFISG